MMFLGCHTSVSVCPHCVCDCDNDSLFDGGSEVLLPPLQSLVDVSVLQKSTEAVYKFSE